MKAIALWVLALLDAAYCEAYWDYVNRWDRLMMTFARGN